MNKLPKARSVRLQNDDLHPSFLVLLYPRPPIRIHPPVRPLPLRPLIHHPDLPPPHPRTIRHPPHPPQHPPHTLAMDYLPPPPRHQHHLQPHLLQAPAHRPQQRQHVRHVHPLNAQRADGREAAQEGEPGAGKGVLGLHRVVGDGEGAEGGELGGGEVGEDGGGGEGGEDEGEVGEVEGGEEEGGVKEGVKAPKPRERERRLVRLADERFSWIPSSESVCRAATLQGQRSFTDRSITSQ